MAKVFTKLSDAISLFQDTSTKKGGMNYIVGQVYTFPEIKDDKDLEPVLGFEEVHGVNVPCLILKEGGVLFLSSLTKRIYTYNCDGSNDIEASYAGGNFVCNGFVEDNESDVFKLVASCANQLDAVKALSGRSIELYEVDKFVGANGDFIEDNGRKKFVPTKLVEKQLPRFRFVEAPKVENPEAETATGTDVPKNTRGRGGAKK